MKIHTLLFLALLLGMGLYGQKTSETALNKTMAQTFVAAIRADTKLPSDQIVIIKNGICADQDCTAVFAGLPVEIYNREDIFMRNIKSYYRLDVLTEVEEGSKWQSPPQVRQ
ncbi:MAG TPA: hypothetical protein VJ953_04985 [Saprospiraceae bacterium]|nr:hypothetical protein [Saprospiraceae bacterium]